MKNVTKFEANNAKKVGKYAFGSDFGRNLKNLYLPAVTEVEDYGLSGCFAEAIYLPAVQTIGEADFDCNMVILGSHLNSIGAIRGSFPATKLFFTGATPPVFKESKLKIHGVSVGIEAIDVDIYVPSKYYNTYNETLLQLFGEELFGEDFNLYKGEPMVEDNNVIGYWERTTTWDHSLVVLELYYNCDYPKEHTMTSAPWASDATDMNVLHVHAENVNFPENSFKGNTKLTNVRTYADTNYGASCFSGCTNLEYVGVDYRSSTPATIVSDNAFYGCEALRHFQFDNVIEIGEKAFYNCKKLTATDDELNKVSIIGASAFENCISMSRINLRGATAIGARAFIGNELAIIKFSEKLTSIGDEAFARDRSFYSGIYVEGYEPPTLGVDAFRGFDSQKTTLYVDQSKADYWIKQAPWNEWTLDKKAYPISGEGWSLSADGVLTIKSNLSSRSSVAEAKEKNIWLNYFDEVNTILIKENVYRIGDYAFYHDPDGKSKLTTVSIPISLEEIGAHAFQNHNKLVTIYVDNVKEVGDEAFAGCSSLERIVFGENCQLLGSRILADTPLLDKFKISTLSPPTVTADTFDDMGQDYGEEAASRGVMRKTTTNAKRRAVRAEVPSVSFNDYVTAEGWDRLIYTDSEHGDIIDKGKEYSSNGINSHWILYEDGLLDISSPDTQIGNPLASATVWRNAEKITSINIHDGPTDIYAVFNNLPNLKTVTLPQSVKTLTHTFYGCTSLESVNFPYVEEIKESAQVGSDGSTWERGTFGGCTSLISVSLPLARKIGDYTFNGCTSLTDVKIAAEELGWYLFKDCTSLSEIDLGNNEPSIGMFEGCTSLTSASLNRSVSSEAFKGCSSIKTISLGDQVEYLTSECFANTGIETIYISTPNPPYDYNKGLGGKDPFGGLDRSKITVYVPRELEKEYKNADMWKDMNVVVDESYEENISKSGMIGNCGRWNIEFEDGTLTFDLWEPLANIDLRDIQYLSRYIKTVVFTDNCTSIGQGTLLFAHGADNYYPNCNKLKLGKNINEIGRIMFYYLNNLKHVYCYAETPPIMNDGGYSYNAPFSQSKIEKNGTVLHVLKKDGVKEAYEAADIWNWFPNIVADLVEGEEPSSDGELVFDDVTLSVGTKTTLPIKLSTTQEIKSLKFTLTVTEGVYVAMDKKGELIATLTTAGGETVKLKGSTSDAHVYQFEMEAENGVTIGTDGANIAIDITTDDNIEAGDFYYARLSGIEMETVADDVVYPEASMVTLTLTDKSAETNLGDINGDGKVDIVDVTTLIDMILKAE